MTTAMCTSIISPPPHRNAILLREVLAWKIMCIPLDSLKAIAQLWLGLHYLGVILGLQSVSL